VQTHCKMLDDVVWW